MDDVDVGLGADRHAAAFTHEFDDALHAHGEAHAGGGTTAEHFNERVVATAAADRALGAELVRDPLEDRVVVVVEAAHEAGIDHVLDAGGGDELLHAGEEGAAFLTEEVEQTRSSVDELLHLGVLRVENAQRIRVETAAGVLVEHVLIALEVLDQGLAVGLAFRQRAERVELEADIAHAEFLPDAGEHHDHLGVNVRTLHAERLGAELVELAVAAALRTLVTEHRAAVPEALRGAVEQAVLVDGAHDGGGAFGTQRELVAVHAVGEGVHLLLHDIGHFADAAGEHLRVFKDRSADFLIAVAFENADGRLLQGLPDGGIGGEHVVHALDAGEFFFAHSCQLSDCPRDDAP